MGTQKLRLLAIIYRGNIMGTITQRKYYGNTEIKNNNKYITQRKYCGNTEIKIVGNNLARHD